jgi:hypothetical protein
MRIQLNSFRKLQSKVNIKTSTYSDTMHNCLKIFPQAWILTVILVGGLPVTYSSTNLLPICWAANISFCAAGLLFVFDFNILPFLVENMTDECTGFFGRAPVLGDTLRESLRETYHRISDDEGDVFDASRFWSESAHPSRHRGQSSRGASAYEDPASGVIKRGSQDGLGLGCSEDFASAVSQASSVARGSESSSVYRSSQQSNVTSLSGGVTTNVWGVGYDQSDAPIVARIAELMADTPFCSLIQNSDTPEEQISNVTTNL